jgi:hypothetical protein
MEEGEVGHMKAGGRMGWGGAAGPGQRRAPGKPPPQF